MESQPRQSTLRWTYQEMRQKPAPRDTFFSMRSEAADHRPISVATEFVDTDWDEEIFSDMEAEDNSPRVSLQSSGQPSITTLSSYEEAITPRSSQDVGIPTSTSASSRKQQIEGPRGPHLFRNSAEQVSADGDITLTLSPITPKTPAGYPDLWYYYDQQQQGRQQQQQQQQQPRGHASSSPPPPVPALPNQSQQSLASASSHSPGPVGPSPRGSPLQFSTAELDVTQLVMWTPEMVAQSMHDAGLEAQVAARFVENDINGPILTTLKFEDLRELGISSFGIRIRVWNQIQFLLDGHAASPRAPTPIEEAPSREVRSEARRNNHSHSHSASSGAGSAGRRSRNNSHSNRSPGGSPSSSQEAIHPGESVSIIGIEQVIPKPHSCSKGSKCSKWRKQARLLEQFRRMNPDVDISSAAGTVLIAGDAGNPETARAINPDEPFRPMSDAEPSVVASSDILGPGGMPPLQYLQETNLRSIQNRDPQDNVIRFLQFQDQGVNEFPPTPPFEPPQQQQQQQHQQALRRLPRLAIPGTNTSQAAPAPGLPRASTMPVRQQQQQQPQQQPRRRQSYMMAKADARSPELNTPPSATAKKQPSPDRYGTPFSEMDVPVTAVPVGPISRDASQSVPPNMNYYNQDLAPSRAASTTPGPPPRAPSRTASRLARAPVMPPVEEQPQTVTSPTLPQATHQLLSQPHRAPPRAVYPWSPVERGNTFETAIPPMALGDGDDAASSSSSTATLNANGGVTHQGPMKRRKAKLLRHEWEDGYFTLRGTRLNMHKDKSHADRTLEYVDIDDYAIACSSLASSSKLSAAFKVMRSAHGRDRAAQDPVGAFQFQLIPQDKTAQGATARLRKRESSFAAPAAAGAGAEGVNGTGKTHHFAVKSRDDRIDWMRELMLAKALKQKGDGFEVSVNGNMI